MAKGTKERLEELQSNLQEKEQEAQRMEGQLTSYLDDLEEKFGTRDLDEIDKLLTQREDENEKQLEELDKKTTEIEAELKEAEETEEKEE